MKRLVAFVFSLGIFGNTVYAAPLGTAFTYQGRLKKDAQVLTETCEFEFTLWDDSATTTCPLGGNQIGPTLFFDGQAMPNHFPSVSISGGLFTVQLDFGVSAFEGSARWLV